MAHGWGRRIRKPTEGNDSYDNIKINGSENKNDSENKRPYTFNV